MKEKDLKGSLYLKNGYYYARIYYYIDGKRKSKDKATGVNVDNHNEKSKTKQERKANRALYEFMKEFVIPENTAMTATEEPMLVDTAKAWFEHVSKSKAPGTQSSYAYIIRDIVLYFEKYMPVKTADLSSSQVEAYLNWERNRRQPGYTGVDKVNSQYKDGAGIESSVMHRYTALRSILYYAKREGIVQRNVASKRDCQISIPKPQRHEFPVLSESEAKNLIKGLASEELWFQVSVVLGLMLGLRRSEIIGLRICDINWESNTLTVSRTATQQTINHKNTVVIKPFTKNRHPKEFTLSEQLLELFRELIEEEQKNKALFGRSYDMQWDGFLIRHMDGRLVSPNRLTQIFTKYLKDHGYREIRFHDLRHSCASILFANGTDLLTIQEILGHAQLTTTIMYTHKISDRKTSALAQMGNLMMPDTPNKKEAVKK